MHIRCCIKATHQSSYTISTITCIHSTVMLIKKFHLTISAYLLGVYKCFLSHCSSFWTWTFDLWGWFYHTYLPFDRKKASNYIHPTKHHLPLQGSSVYKKHTSDHIYKPGRSIEILIVSFFIICDVNLLFLGLDLWCIFSIGS